MTLPEQIGYVNARLRARKSRLLGDEVFRALRESASVEEMIDCLRSTRYGAQLAIASVRETSPLRVVDLAVARTLEEDLETIRRFVPGLSSTPAAYLFLWWDLRNLKVVLRGVQGRRRSEEIAAACYAGGWVPAALWRDIAASRNLEAAVGRVAVLDIPGKRAVVEAWPDAASRGTLAPVEAALDRGLAEETLSQLAGLSQPFWAPVEDLVRFDLDARNLGCLVECWARSEAPLHGELLAGGRWTEASFRRAAEEAPDLAPLLAEHLPRWAGEEGARILLWMSAGRPGQAQGALREWSWGWRRRQLHGAPLSLGVLVGYVWYAVTEAARLRQLVWRLHVGLPAGEPE